MDSFLEGVYLLQAKQECQSCFAALRRFNDAGANQEDPFPYAIQAVHHAAAVSRFFWPPGSPNKKSAQRSRLRGACLRESLGLSEDHPIKERALRDHFEHFDERLDEWAERSKNRNIIIQVLGPREAIGGDCIEDGDIIHHYDPQTRIYAFCGKKYDIQKLADGLADLYKKIHSRLRELGPPMSYM